jgi:hypothetical protein
VRSPENQVREPTISNAASARSTSSNAAASAFSKAAM